MTPELLPLLGVPAMAGRVFTPADSTDQQVIVLSHALCKPSLAATAASSARPCAWTESRLPSSALCRPRSSSPAARQTAGPRCTCMRTTSATATITIWRRGRTSTASRVSWSNSSPGRTRTPERASDRAARRAGPAVPAAGDRALRRHPVHPPPGLRQPPACSSPAQPIGPASWRCAWRSAPVASAWSANWSPRASASPSWVASSESQSRWPAYLCSPAWCRTPCRPTPRPRLICGCCWSAGC